MIVKNEAKTRVEFYNNKDDLSIFFMSSKNFDIPKNLKTKKVVLSSCKNFVDKNFDIFLPVVFDKEEIAIKTKSVVLFCFAILFLLSNGEVENLKLAIACQAYNQAKSMSILLRLFFEDPFLMIRKRLQTFS